MPNVAPKPTGQSSSHSISRVPLQISSAHCFVFDLPLNLRVVHIRKKFKIFIFSKMAPIFIKFCAFIAHSNLNNKALSSFPEKILVTRIIFFNYYLSPHIAPKPTDQSCSNSIFRSLLKLSPAHCFHFRPTLNIKDTLMLGWFT